MISSFLLSCSQDGNDRAFFDSNNLRLKSYSYDDTIQSNETFFDYDDLGQLSEIMDNYRVKKLTYNQKGQLVNINSIAITYDENGNFIVIQYNEDEFYDLEYNEQNQISRIIESDGNITTAFDYDNKHRIISAINYIFSNETLFSTLRSNFYYDANDRIIKEVFGTVYPDQEYDIISETTYEYSNLLNPLRLLYESSGVDPDNAIINLGFNSKGINLGGLTHFPKHMFKKIERKGEFLDDYYIDFNFTNNSYGYPNDGEKIRKTVSDITTTTQESWKFEELQ